MTEMRKLINIINEAYESNDRFIADAIQGAAGVIEWGTEEDLMPQDAYEDFWKEASEHAYYMHHTNNMWSDPDPTDYTESENILNRGVSILKEILDFIKNQMEERGNTPQLQKFKEMTQNALDMCYKALDVINPEDDYEDTYRRKYYFQEEKPNKDRKDRTWRDEAEQEMSVDPDSPYYVAWSEQAYDEETGRPKGDAGGIYAINIKDVEDAENLVDQMNLTYGGYYFDSMSKMGPEDSAYLRVHRDKVKDYSKF